MDGIGARPPAIYVLDADPDLAQDVPEGERGEARQRSLARVFSLEGSRWDPSDIAAAARPDWMGLFVVDGLLVRCVTVAHRASCELFGAGDLLRPWDEDGDYRPLTVSVEWLVIQPARLAVLDSAFARRLACWPSIAATLIRRIASRARHISLASALTHLPRTHARLLLLFWVLGERWGAVTRAGVMIKLPLTHQLLAMLVGNHRPSVTIALQRLARDGLLLRPASDRWLLTTKGIESLHKPA